MSTKLYKFLAVLNALNARLCYQNIKLSKIILWLSLSKFCSFVLQRLIRKWICGPKKTSKLTHKDTRVSKNSKPIYSRIA